MLNKRNKRILKRYNKASDLQQVQMKQILQSETDNLLELLIEMK